MSLSTEESTRRYNSPLADIFGQVVQATLPATPVGIPPAGVSFGAITTRLQIRPVTAAIWLTFHNPGPVTDPGAQLAGNTEYDFLLDPSVNTIFLAAPAATSVILRWSMMK